MKRILALMIIVLALAGCSEVDVTTPDPVCDLPSLEAVADYAAAYGYQLVEDLDRWEAQLPTHGAPVAKVEWEISFVDDYTGTPAIVDVYIGREGYRIRTRPVTELGNHGDWSVPFLTPFKAGKRSGI